MTESHKKVRVEWPDFARGICMFLVILWHSSAWVHDELYGGPPAPWVQFGIWLTPLRMPLFFFISGYFSMTLLARPLRTARRRTWGLFYLYVIWTFLFLCRLYLPQARDQGPAPTIGEMVTALVLPTSFWYLWCLPSFFLITYGIHRWLGDKGKWLILPLLVLAVVAPLVRPYTMHILVQPMDAVKAPSFLANLVWFVAGAYLRPQWDALMRNASWKKCGIAVVLYAAIWFGASQWMPSDEFAWQLVPLSIVAIFASAQALALIPMSSRAAQATIRVGQDTLPIYIFHIFSISVISAGVKALGLVAHFRNDLPNLAWVIPPIMVAVLVPATLGMAWVVRHTPFAVLLQAPVWLTNPNWSVRRDVRARADEPKSA